MSVMKAAMELESQYPPTTSPVPGGSRDMSPEQTLDNLSSRRASETTSMQMHETPAVPPPDTGYAWTFLAAGFIIETLAFGFVFSIGVLHEFWTTSLFPDPQAASTITLATTLNGGLMYITAVVAGPIFARFPLYRSHLQYAGLAVSVAGIIASAFATQPWHLVITAGVLYPLGGCTYYLPAATLLFTWWQRKRGCVMYSGTGIGGAVFPFIMQALLNRFSYKVAVISLGLAYGMLGAGAVFFIRERIPVPKHTALTPRRPIPLTFLRKTSFYAFVLAILLTSCGNFIPNIYLPSYALDLGLTTTQGTLLVTIMNASSVVGLLLLGYLSDRWPTRAVVSLSCLGASISCFLLWGFATQLPVLIIFSLAFGFFALGFAALWNKLITIIAGDDPLLPPLLFSIFAFARGIGNVLSGPISTALLQGGGLDHAKLGYGVENYGSLLLWTGSIIALGSLAGVSYKDKEV